MQTSKILPRNNGFLQLRRGIQEHILSGRLSALELAAYVLMLLHADYSTGIWWGSAKLLSGLFGCGDIDKRAARSLLETIESKGYIRRFVTRRSHRNYPILIDNYDCLQVDLQGAYSVRRLSAKDTIDYRQPVYVALPTGGLQVPSIYKEEEQKEDLRTGDLFSTQEKRDPSVDLAATAKTSPPTEELGPVAGKPVTTPKPRRKPNPDTDPRHGLIRSHIQAWWLQKNPGYQAAPWDGAEGKALSEVLSSNPSWTTAQFCICVNHRFRSEENHADRPRKWLPSLTGYARGTLDRFGKPLDLPKRNGGYDVREIERENLRVATARLSRDQVAKYFPGYVRPSDRPAGSDRVPVDDSRGGVWPQGDGSDDPGI